ncbi:hypothetical protein NAI64_02930 [Oxalobacter sp. OxGP1]|uniref:hypothetical protein n=1 Tax=Oxalobacter paeniformigenes TaxID=2946594 RepID=UPI0022AE828F|nr:hypothetical protein [Oxalobacter paeniformigenes]MCZ4052677.1 hypothetical protein [Oxalobacter paeniformigenes]
MQDRLVNIHYEIIRNSAGNSPEIAEGIGDALLRHSNGHDLGEVATALLAGNRDEVFDLMEKILDDAIWAMATEQSQENDPDGNFHYND